MDTSPVDSGSPAPLAKSPPETTLGVRDLGVFGDLDPRVWVALPGDLDAARIRLVIDEGRRLVLVYLGDRPVKVYPIVDGADSRPLSLGARTLALRPGDHGELVDLFEPVPLVDRSQVWVLEPGTTAPPGDRDLDGIPDPLDLDLGAIKTTLNGATYNQDYFTLAYPGGDVDRGLGACTDVIVRALRNAGVDLQVEVHEDIAAVPRRYPMVTKANASIDHRRVRTLLPWFRAHWIALAPDAELAPGDVVFMDTIAARKGPDHIGILGDQLIDGRLLVANNWTDGYQTSFMDLLEFVEVSDRFRMAPEPGHAGPISGFTRQLVVVRSPGWASFRAEAQRWERATVNGEWVAVGERIPVVLGHGGLGWGRGVHGDGAPTGLTGPIKQEGDGRSPAGVFTIGGAYGQDPQRATALDYTSETSTLRCVDDPDSAHYGEIVDAETTKPDWASAEAMRRLYTLAIVIEHNPEHLAAGGSCIFVHPWDGPDKPVTGCTAMASEDVDTLADWLEPGAVLVALPTSSYTRLSGSWSLPSWPDPDPDPDPGER